MFKSLSLAGLVALLLSAPTQAAVLTVNFMGDVDTVNGAFPFPISPASTFTGSFTFDTEAIDTDPSDVVGIYESTGAPYGLQLTVGGNSYSYTNLQQIVRSDRFNFYTVQASDSETGFSLLFADPVGATVNDPIGAGFTSDDLPTFLPSGERFITRRVNFGTEAVNGFEGTIRPVPEPSEILGTVALGVIGVSIYLLKRKKTSAL